MDTRAVGKECRLALLLDWKRKAGCEQIRALESGKLAEGIVGIGDRAVAVAAHDDVALRLEKALRALLRLPDFPVAVGRFLEARLEIPQLRLHLADARNKNGHRPARGAEQCRDADREQVWVVMRRMRRRPGQEAEGDRKRHRRDDGRADDEGEEFAGENGGFSEGGAWAHGPLFPLGR